MSILGAVSEAYSSPPGMAQPYSAVGRPRPTCPPSSAPARACPPPPPGLGALIEASAGPIVISEVQRILRTQGPLSQPSTVKGAREEGADVRGVSAWELTVCEPDSHSPTSLFNTLHWCLSLPVSAFSGQSESVRCHTIECKPVAKALRRGMV